MSFLPNNHPPKLLCILCEFNIKYIKIRISNVYAFFSLEKNSLLFNGTFFCKCPVLIYLHARELFMFLFSSADFLQNKVFTNKPPRTIIGVSNCLDLGQD